MRTEGSHSHRCKVDPNIRCWSTGKLYTEALLGVGISREKKNLGTAAELISKECCGLPAWIPVKFFMFCAFSGRITNRR